MEALERGTERRGFVFNRRAIVTHGVFCLDSSLRALLCGTSGIVLSDEAFEEEILLPIIAEEQLSAALQVGQGFEREKYSLVSTLVHG
jgi:hypothetical protein